jgi:hypothetical protein
MGGAYNTYGEMRNVQKFGSEILKRRGQSENAKHRWEDDIEQILRTRVVG